MNLFPYPNLLMLWLDLTYLETFLWAFILTSEVESLKTLGDAIVSSMIAHAPVNTKKLSRAF